MKLFGTDGIRGRYGDYPLDDRTVYAVGLALAHHIASSKKQTVLIGMDTRESSAQIAQLLAAGLHTGGVACDFAGIVPTPAVAQATQHGDFALGIVVSASHNPFEDNGIKVFGPFGYKLPDETEAAIERRIEAVLSDSLSPERVELDENPEIALGYIRHLLKATGIPSEARNLRFVVDCAHGAASGIAPIAFDSLGLDVSFIGCDPNGRNINLDCGALHLGGLAERVVASGADFGAALDGDADRCLFVDERGATINGDNLLLAAATALKGRGILHDDLVVATVMSNLGLDMALRQQGIRLLRSQVGDKYVIQEMLKSGAALGGEQSGHMIFGDFSTTGDGMLTLFMMLRILADERVAASDLRKRLKAYPQKLINVRVREKRPLDELPEIRQAVAERQLQLADRGRVLIRYSGTEPLVRVMVEAERLSDVTRHCAEIASLFEQHLGQ